MSKASDWAKAEHTVTDLWAHLGRFEMTLTTAPLDGVKDYTFCAGVGRVNDAPMLCFTDYRLGSVAMNQQQAVALARWILDTFGDEP